MPDVDLFAVKNLKKNGVIKLGTSIEKQEILVGRLRLKPQEKTNITRIVRYLLKKNLIEDISLRTPRAFTGVITKLEISSRKDLLLIVVHVTEKRKIQIGDKIAGRHGNKGIISNIVPYIDMPYLPDGTPVDMILNPLGIPSRMNVGQVFEGLLNLAAINLNERYLIQPFDEIEEDKSSQIFIYRRLNEARKKTKKSWLFNPNYPGKAVVIDGRTGRAFAQTVSIGFAYILKLIHLVKDKIHSRLIGPYSLIVKQPLRGRAQFGGQRFGEMEVWAIEGFGAAYSLQELLTIKSDDVTNRSKALFSLMVGTQFPKPNVPEAFNVFILEMQSLCFDITIFTKNPKYFC